MLNLQGRAIPNVEGACVMNESQRGLFYLLRVRMTLEEDPLALQYESNL
jgi:hypothetical protein